MKCVVAIVSSDQQEYKDFKQIVVQTIKNAPNIFEFYFLANVEGESSPSLTEPEVTKHDYGYTDITFDTSGCTSVSESIFIRTVKFYSWYFEKENVKMKYQKHAESGLFFLRTNLSTLFNFRLLEQFLESLPKTNFLGGPFIGPASGRISGTCTIMSFDTAWLLLMNKSYIKVTDNLLEDEAVSLFLFNHFKLLTCTVNRLDTIEMKTPVVSYEKSVVFHKCKRGDPIFCFRFKTFDRRFDYGCMKRLLSVKFDVNEYVKLVALKVSTEAPEYASLYKNPK